MMAGLAALGQTLCERDWPILRQLWVLVLATLLVLNRTGLWMVAVLLGHVGFSMERRRPTDGAFHRR